MPARWSSRTSTLAPTIVQTKRSGIHPTAQIDPAAELGAGVTVGAGCVVGPRVRIGDGCVLHAHALVEGETEIGPNCSIYPFTVLGFPPQDKKMRRDVGALTRERWIDDDSRWLGKLRIGADNEIREHVTMQGGTPWGVGETRIGDGNMFLAGSHVGHDSTVGSHCVFTNGAMAAGHSVIQDHAILGAMVGVHQFARVGRFAMIGAGSMLSHDAPPFSLVQGDRARLVALNLIGLRRSGFGVEQIALLKRTYRLLFWRSGLLEERIAHARELGGGNPLVEEILEFVERSGRGVCTPRGRVAPGDEPMERA